MASEYTVAQLTTDGLVVGKAKASAASMSVEVLIANHTPAFIPSFTIEVLQSVMESSYKSPLRVTLIVN